MQRWGTLASALIVCLLSVSAKAQCSLPNRISWPSVNPVWRLCWVAPANSSGPYGSGLEIQNAYYKDKLVLSQANIPVVNVRYDWGSGTACGPTYRDDMHEVQAFEADNVISPGYAEPSDSPTTVCDHPGSDEGSFSGVAVEKLPDRLILTTQLQAGWYRYVQKWIFHLDGTIEPQFGFTAVAHACTSVGHDHHAYFRFDFDIDGKDNDIFVQRYNIPMLSQHPSSWGFKVFKEKWSYRRADTERRWRVMDHVTGRGVEIQPGDHDPISTDKFSRHDLWALRYNDLERDDGGPTTGPMANAVHIDPFVNSESIYLQDVVVWYRVGHQHMGAPTCTMVGPKIVLVGEW